MRVLFDFSFECGQGLVQCVVGIFILTAAVQFSGEGACKYVPSLYVTLRGEILL
jgi:hypothetical protein